MRAGTYVKQPTGYQAFIPAQLPPSIVRDAEMDRLLSDADRALGRLDGVATVLPNPDLFVAMYVRQEAVLSSQIEGTQSTLEDLLQYEARGRSARGRPKDVSEVINYVSAMNHGLARLPDLPLSLRLLREIHAQLLKGVRGSDRRPGEFRRSQNWVGPPGCSLNEAEYIPPPPHEMQTALGELEVFLHDREGLPILIQCAVAHAQFETIHPFLDGNGRVGRLLITLMLCERGVLQRPLLYLSCYLKAHRGQYYDRLMAIRHEGDWERWIKFFLRGIYETSQGATSVARDIVHLREANRQEIASVLPNARNAQHLLDHLFQFPMLSVHNAESVLECSYATANALVGQFVKLGILRETTGRSRNRLFLYEPYWELFDRLTQEAKPANQGSKAITQK